MARKRVSLKDKGPETLGLTEKKGQGIDVLFGGPTAARTRSASVASESKITNQPKVEVKNMAADKNNLTNSMVASPESLPVNEADDDLNSATLQGVDELGLPVAMEAPPANLVAAGVTTGEVDELGLPVAMETPPTDLTMPVPPLAPPPAVGTDDNDLSGLAGEEQDLSGLATDAAAPPASQPVNLPFTPPAEPAPLPEPPPVPTF
ncbi:MAG TPA: hypothetical protein VEC93_03515, partial [Anaerolineae bacterium]|nr:hypothetical protein [Anaerolineae bacterium]